MIKKIAIRIIFVLLFLFALPIFQGTFFDINYFTGEGFCQPKTASEKCPDNYVPGTCSPNPCKELESCSTRASHPQCHMCTGQGCPASYSKGRCTSDSCSENEVCQPDNSRKCHRCMPKPDWEDCPDGYAPGTCSPNPCQQYASCSTRASHPLCHMCTGQGCPDGFQKGSCTSQTCSEDETCQSDKSGKCYRCMPKPEKEKCPDGYVPGTCSPNPCELGDSCSTRASHPLCHKCNSRCPDGYSLGKCSPNPCERGQSCSTLAKYPCYMCRNAMAVQDDGLKVQKALGVFEKRDKKRIIVPVPGYQHQTQGEESMIPGVTTTPKAEDKPTCPSSSH